MARDNGYMITEHEYQCTIHNLPWVIDNYMLATQDWCPVNDEIAENILTPEYQAWEKRLLAWIRQNAKNSPNLTCLVVQNQKTQQQTFDFEDQSC